jgi:hypothetical protein
MQKGMDDMSTSVWPAEYLREPHDIHRQDGNSLVVFLISPFNPKERYDGLFAFCHAVCVEVGAMIGATVACVRADSHATPVVLHPEIWAHIQSSDAIIADVSEENGNVMLELGVAASFRDKDRVIIIKDDSGDRRFLFDIQPARHLIYQRDLAAALEFRKKLIHALLFALASAPHIPRSTPVVEPPLDLNFDSSDSCACLLGPSNAHRRLLSDGLEFGSLYVFRYSWLTLGNLQFSTVHVRSEMRFSELRPGLALGEGWIGIMLRSQHFFAHCGHLIYVKSDGSVRCTQPIDELATPTEDPVLGKIEGFQLDSWVTFDLRFDDRSLSGNVNGVEFYMKVSEMPYTYHAGFLRFQTHCARATIRTLRVDVPAQANPRVLPTRARREGRTKKKGKRS